MTDTAEQTSGTSGRRVSARAWHEAAILGNCAAFILFHLLKKIFFFLVALDLHCCMQVFSSCGEQGLLFIAVRGLLIAVASLVAEHGL